MSAKMLSGCKASRWFSRRTAPILLLLCLFSIPVHSADHLTGIKARGKEKGDLSLLCLFDSSRVAPGSECKLSMLIQSSNGDAAPASGRIVETTVIRPFQAQDGAGVVAAHYILSRVFDFDSVRAYSGALTFVSKGGEEETVKIASDSADLLEGRRKLGDRDFTIVKKRTTAIHDFTKRDSNARPTSRLSVQFAATPSSKGVIRVVVYEQEGYVDKLNRDANHELFGLIVKAREGTTSAVIPSLPFGEYVILAFHDEDEDNDQRNSLFHFEKAGFSRNARPQISKSLPPLWSDAKISVDQRIQSIEIALKGRLEIFGTRSR